MKKRFHFILIIAVIICALPTQAQVITTIAGNGINGYTGDDSTALNASFAPAGLTVDAAGNIYFGDIVHNVVRKIDAAGIITTIAGNGIEGSGGNNIPATNSPLDWPSDVAVDREGNVYISENISDRIRKVTPDGIITTVAGGGGGRDLKHDAIATHVSIWAPDGIAVDSAGTFYFAERFNHCISKVTKDGIISTIAGTGSGGYNGDDIPATDAQLNSPMGITLDAVGNIYVADRGNERVRKISTGGIITTVAGTGVYGYNGDNIPATTSQLSYTRDVAVDKDGNVYIADENNQRIRKVDGAGNITTVAGTGVVGYTGDGGPAVDAQLKAPGCIALNSFGNLYIADIGNFRIRRVRYSLSVKGSEPKVQAISIYPNPNNGSFVATCAISDLEKARLVMTNILGETVINIEATPNKNIQIHADVPSGVYMINVSTNEDNYSTRVSIIK